MIHILLCILKIIGITLLLLLGMIIVLLLLVLFVPLRYRVNAVKGEEDRSYAINAGASWLLHIFSAHFGMSAEEEASYQVRILGIAVYDSRKREEYAAKKAAKEAKSAVKREKAASSQDSKHNRQRKPGKEQKDKLRPAAGGKTEPVEAREDITEKRVQHNPEGIRKSGSCRGREASGEDTVQENGKESGFLEKLKEFFGMLLGKLKNIRYTIDSFCDKIKQIVNDISYYKEVLEKEESKMAFRCCGKQLKAVWKNICPPKLKLTVTAGFDDPADTGQLLAIYSMIYPWVYDNIRLEPDFERPVLKGTFYCKGRITVFVLLKAAWILYFDKNIRTFLRLWKKEETLDG